MIRCISRIIWIPIKVGNSGWKCNHVEYLQLIQPTHEYKHHDLTRQSILNSNCILLKCSQKLIQIADLIVNPRRQRKKILTAMVISIEKGPSNMQGDFVIALYMKYCLHCALIEGKHILFIKCQFADFCSDKARV